MQSISKKLKYIDLVRFFVPIAVMSMIMKSSHNLISSALAQMDNPAVALTAYSVAFNVAAMIQAPIWVLSKVTTAVAHNRSSAKISLKVAWQAGFLVCGIFVLIAYTPLKNIVFVRLMGVSPEILPEILKAFKLFFFMPFFGVIRATHQSFIALRRKTLWLTTGTVLRIFGMIIFTFIITKLRLVNGSAAGVVILLFGFGIEALVWFIKGRPWLKEAPAESDSNKIHNTELWLMLLPLMIAQLINGFVNPGISAGLARAENPELAISSYFLARSIAWIFLAVSFSMSQIVLVFVKRKADWVVVKRFVYVLSLTMSALLALIAFTPLGDFVYLNVLQVDPVLANEAIKTLAFFVIALPAMLLAELYQGLMLKERRSKNITICKVSNVIVLLGSLYIFIGASPQLGSMIGSICFAIAYYAELIIAYLLSRKHLLEDKTSSGLALKRVS